MNDILKKFRFVLKHPLTLLPTVVIMGIWILLGILKSRLGESGLLSWLDFLTFAQGGLFGGVAGAIGGILGKILVATLLNALLMPLFLRGTKTKLRFADGFKQFGQSFAFESLGGLAPLFLGMGLALLLYSFFNITQRWQEGLVGIVGALVLIQSIGRRGGLLFSLVYCVISLLSKNKVPSQIAVTRFLSGMSIGFIVGTGLNMAGLRWAVLISLCLLVLGVFFLLFNKRRKAAVAAACIAVFLLIPVDAQKDATDQLRDAASQLDAAIAEGRRAVDELNNLEPVNMDAVDLDKVTDYNNRINAAEMNHDQREVDRLTAERDAYIRNALGIQPNGKPAKKGRGGNNGPSNAAETLTKGWAGEDSYVDSEGAAAALEATGGALAVGAGAGLGTPFGGGEGPWDGGEGPDFPEGIDPSSDPEERKDWEVEESEGFGKDEKPSDKGEDELEDDYEYEDEEEEEEEEPEEDQ